MDKKYKEEKRVFEKHIQKLYKNEKGIYSCFKDKSFGQKKAPAGRRTAKKKISNSHMKNVSGDQISDGCYLPIENG